jgi:peptidoglycan/xylan/chitin deacetylase (PgdA/CDA1 family)
VQITAGQTGEFIVSPLYVRPEMKTHVAIVFDDGWAEEFSNAYPYMQARGIPGSSAFLGSLQNGLTIANALTMRDNGWSFHNHTFDHPNLTSLQDSEIRSQIERTRTVLEQAGLHDSGDLIFLPPQGARNAAVDQIIAEYYPYNSWGATGSMWGHSGRLRFTSDQPRALSRFNIDNPVTLNSAVAALNSAIEQGADLAFYGHKPIAGAAVGNLELSTLTGLIDVLHLYQQAGRIRVLNYQDLVRTLWDPRKQRIA